MSPTSSRKIVGLHELAGLAPDRSGKGALLVSEELGLDQFLRDRRTVDLDERAAGDPGALVDLPRHEFLARAALPHDQDRRAGRRRARDLGAKPLDRLALSDEHRLFLESAPQALVLRREAVAGDGIGERDENPLALEGLLQEVHRSAAGGFDRGRDVAVAGDHEDRRRAVPLGDPVENLHPVHARHLDVEQDRVDAIAVESGEGGLSLAGRCDFVALVFQDHPEGVADAGIVVDDEDSLGHRR
jgi:hypothetical protein